MHILGIFRLKVRPTRGRTTRQGGLLPLPPTHVHSPPPSYSAHESKEEECPHVLAKPVRRSLLSRCLSMISPKRVDIFWRKRRNSTSFVVNLSNFAKDADRPLKNEIWWKKKFFCHALRRKPLLGSDFWDFSKVLMLGLFRLKWSITHKENQRIGCI